VAGPQIAKRLLEFEKVPRGPILCGDRAIGLMRLVGKVDRRVKYRNSGTPRSTARSSQSQGLQRDRAGIDTLVRTFVTLSTASRDEIEPRYYPKGHMVLNLQIRTRKRRHGTASFGDPLLSAVSSLYSTAILMLPSPKHNRRSLLQQHQGAPLVKTR
jgi:hypothetical protein